MTGVIDWTGLDDAGRKTALARPQQREDASLQDAVRDIIADVRDGGWDALCAIATRIDGSAPGALEVAPYAKRARTELPAEALAAIRLAADNIETFHRATLPQPVSVETMPGLTVEKRWAPLGSAGLYVPGGKAPLFSTLLMLAIPARVAGVEWLTVVTPPRPDGGLDPAVALAAEICGVERIWTVGGAQAIAALAFGAGDIAPVDRICGPGNAWVAAAKRQVSSLPGGPGIDLPAGPSELLVIADATSDPARVAADLLSQAEHDRDAQVLLVSTSDGAIAAALAEVDRQAADMGGDFAPVRAIRCADLTQAVTIANAYAPEHLSIALADDVAADLAARITDAGAVFVGEGAAESFGDYLAGSSHVLPTDGAARYTGGVTALTYLKAISIQRISPDTARRLAAPAAALARLEGLEAHARAAEIRGAAIKEPAL
ncbi:histidinol dehydrogenase [Sphingomicrobium aestuariivivum]|uniref:histidinol dehydrogenase n=1 Tax=Sphingomicrobium aestuariivivum TaxID=1582356 RepID=UPI001FD715B5|nr:histidinol dehydrogenase [Sphingomicrobium aestuariivivum]MCJ8191127.1 histidinol dehydrogenase [Sphingomicrobium aestuariivivum]